MFKERFTKGLLTAAVTLAVGSGLAAAQPGASGGAAAEAAASLAARSDVFQATTARLNVVPEDLAGGCPQGYAFDVYLGAGSPGTLSYRFVTADGRRSQVFEAKTAATEEGLFAAKVSHKLALAEGGQAAADPALVVFDPLEDPEPAPKPGFFGRLFGTAAPAQDTAQGLRDQAFQVKVVAPNEVASPFDQHSVSCDDQRQPRVIPIAEDQRDGGDRGGRGRGDRDRGGDRGDRGRSGPAGRP